MFKKLKIILIFVTYQAWSFSIHASTDKHTISPTQALNSETSEEIKAFCKEFSDKLRTVKYQGCLDLKLQSGSMHSVEDRLLTYREYTPSNAASIPLLPKGRILLISGIHGDEYSGISITYLWMMSMLKHTQNTRHHWLFLPLANPDGLFRSDPATRENARGVDLNRNFPSPDWDELALKYWDNYYRKNKRRYPGPTAGSEPENRWLVETIERFKPDAIISIHAPYGLLDYDGPEHAIPNKIGQLKHKELGTYPGSLGRYAGEYLNIPVLTLELASAGRMPNEDEIFQMWQDIEKWSQTKIEHKEIDF